MKTNQLLIVLLNFIILTAYSQEAKKPSVSFEHDPESYCMHICWDGYNYYTINGGVSEVGKITGFSAQGVFLGSYNLRLDMRSIFYHPVNKHFYICTTDKKLYKIIDLSAGTYELVYENLYENKQLSLSIDPKGKFLYAFDNGTLSIHKFKNGNLIRQLSGLKCGDGNRKGGATVAVDKYFNVYTWDSESKTVYVYDKKGTFKKSFTLAEGDFGYSLSFANNKIFVSKSSKGKKGKWFGYSL